MCLPKLLSLFAKDGVDHPCGIGAKYPVGSKECQDYIRFNFALYKFERYYDPRISVAGGRAVVKLLLESGDYLADYSFALSRQGERWMVSETDWDNVRWKGYE